LTPLGEATTSSLAPSEARASLTASVIASDTAFRGAVPAPVPGRTVIAGPREPPTTTTTGSEASMQPPRGSLQCGQLGA
jgi:hypothetical protein